MPHEPAEGLSPDPTSKALGPAKRSTAIVLWVALSATFLWIDPRLSVLVFSLVVLYRYCFVKRNPLWGFGGQFIFLSAATQVVPYYIDGNYSALHLSLVLVSLAPFLWSPNQTVGCRYAGSLSLRPLVLYFLVAIAILDVTWLGLNIYQVLLTIAMFTGTKINFPRSALLGAILMVLTIMGAIDSGNRRELFYAIVPIVALLYLYKNDWPVLNGIALVIGVPIFAVASIWLGYERVGMDGVQAVLSVRDMRLDVLLGALDVGMYLPTFRLAFTRPEFVDWFSSHYFTGISYERLFYMAIPRGIFEEKPLSSVEVIAEMMSRSVGSGATSLASGVQTEMYLNFRAFAFVAAPLFTLALIRLEAWFLSGKGLRFALYVVFCSAFLQWYRGAIETGVAITMLSCFISFMIMWMFGIRGYAKRIL